MTSEIVGQEAGKSFAENVFFSPTGLKKKKSGFGYFVILLFTEKLL